MATVNDMVKQFGGDTKQLVHTLLDSGQNSEAVLRGLNLGSGTENEQASGTRVWEGTNQVDRGL